LLVSALWLNAACGGVASDRSAVKGSSREGGAENDAGGAKGSDVGTGGRPAGGAGFGGASGSGKGNAGRGTGDGTGGLPGSGGGINFEDPPFLGYECPVTDDHAEIEVYVDGRALPDAGVDVDLDESITGSVQWLGTSSFEVSRCPIDESDCRNEPPSVVRITARGLDLTIAMVNGVFVRVRHIRTCDNGCSESILVSSLPSLWGHQNPLPAPSGMYVAAVEGDVTPPPGSPFTVSAISELCTDAGLGFTGPPCRGFSSGIYYFDVTEIGASSAAFDMGWERWLGHLMFHNLRSYVGSSCEAPFGFGYWAANYVEAIPARDN